MTFSNNPQLITPVKTMMMGSREAVVNYMNPLGLHHIMGRSHHYGPGPWVEGGGRADWTSLYYHRATTEGIGFDRTKTGSNAVSQYFPPVQKQFANVKTCPEEFLLWFHHLPWTYKVKSGRELWDELCYRYSGGVDSVRQMRKTWDSLAPLVDEERFRHVQMFLGIQEKEAKWWRDACLVYFQTFSQRPIPQGLEKPAHSLDYYKSLNPRFVPGI
jgi:alpha-glucuronidase